MELGTNETILILFTTLYRTGGVKFARAAQTMLAEKKKQFPALNFVCKAVESKSDFLAEIENIKNKKQKITEFHFIGHSGVYGIMFGTTQWPEQFSPFEWRNMSIPFSPNAHFYFHACRTGRWFAAFIARTLNVDTSGNYLYTTVSKSPDRFVWEGPFSAKHCPLYIIAAPGKKSHGVMASALKYLGFVKAVPMLTFKASQETVDASYDSVAELYDETFDDIAVRADELTWIKTALGSSDRKTVLDIGCGNAALLQKISGQIEKGVGVDISQGMIAQAKKRCTKQNNLSFEKIDGPLLPFPDNSFDSVISVLAFRYLDWDPILKEILRVLKPGGQIAIMDMVAAPVRLKELPFFVSSKLALVAQRMTQQRYWTALTKMVTDPRWKKMLMYNPIRSEHEMKWFFESRFPGFKTELLNVGWNSRILAFHAKNVQIKEVEKTLYP
jgi:ubiquinone/menaquinone biosynthesis C-methylase UbiE